MAETEPRDEGVQDDGAGATGSEPSPPPAGADTAVEPPAADTGETLASTSNEPTSAHAKLIAEPGAPEEPGTEDNEDWAPADAGFWGQGERVQHPLGREPRDIAEDLQRFCDGSHDCIAVVVAGEIDIETQWVAEHVAQAGSPSEVRRITTHSLSNHQFPEILREVGKTPRRCLVVDYWPSHVAEDLASSIEKLGDAVAGYSGAPCRLVLWTRKSDVARRRTEGSWPENIRFFSLARRADDNAPSSDEQARDEAFFLDLFGGALSSVPKLIRSRERAIERTLVRIAVLFGPLAVSDLDVLMSAALDDVEVPVRDEDNPEAHDVVPAQELWKMGKEMFLQNSALARSARDGDSIVAFPDPDVHAAASTAAWRDPEAMIDVFSATTKLGLLFDDESERRQRELFDGYVSALLSLAQHAPRSFGRLWLPLIRSDYAKWAQVTEIADDADTLERALRRLVATESPATRRSHGRRLARRVGYVCRYLLVQSDDFVEEVLETLMRAAAYEILWWVLLEVRGRPYDGYHHWIKRLLAEAPLQVATGLTQALGREAVHDPAASLDTIRQFAEWLPSAPPTTGAAIAAAAGQLPLILLDEAYRCHERRRDVALDLGRLLASPLSEDAEQIETIGAYVENCLVLNASQDGPDSDELSVHRTAVALFQLAVACGEDASCAVDIASAVKRRLPAPRRREVKRELRSIADWFLERRSRLPLNASTRTERNFLMERAKLCKILTQA